MRISDGGKCPKTNKHVMIRSDMGCLRCKHKSALIGDGKKLSVDCSWVQRK